jgi:hypothetical protein
MSANRRILAGAICSLCISALGGSLWIWNEGRRAPYELVYASVGTRVVGAYSRSGGTYVFVSARGTQRTLLRDEWEKWSSADPQRRFDGSRLLPPSLCLQLPSLKPANGFLSLHVPQWNFALVIVGGPTIAMAWSRRKCRQRTEGFTVSTL